MRAIEFETQIDEHGHVTIPEEYHDAYGKQARLVVLLADKEVPVRKRQARAGSKGLLAPVRLPGLNFDTFEGAGGPAYEEAHGTDRAPTYQSRSAATSPKSYVQRILSWMAGRPRKASAARRTRLAAHRRVVKGAARRHLAHRRGRASTAVHKAMH